MKRKQLVHMEKFKVATTSEQIAMNVQAKSSRHFGPQY